MPNSREPRTLADAVLPLIRSTRSDLWRYSAANEQGSLMHEGIDLLEAALAVPETLPPFGIQAPTPKETYAVTHKALASAIHVIARADDSAGIIGDACRRLINLHPQAALTAQVPQTRLADWFFRFHFNDKVDYFQLDPVAYAPALGEKGLTRLRSLVAELRSSVPPAEPEARYSSRGYDALLADWFEQRFAVLDRDIEAIIRTHLRNGKVAAWYEDVAEALEEIEEIDHAMEWAERATMFGHGHQSERASTRWWRLLCENRPQELPAAAQTIFERWPTSANAARLVEAAGDNVIEEIEISLKSHPAELVCFQLDTLRDPHLAWESAGRLELADDWVWAALAETYFSIDPAAAVQVQLRIVAGSLEVANTRKYRPAARKIAKIRKVVLATKNANALAIVDNTIADFRERYARRPRLIAELDRAQLP